MSLAVTLVNLTPHRINVLEGERIVAAIPPSGNVARLEQEPAPEGRLFDHPLAEGPGSRGLAGEPRRTVVSGSRGM